MKKVSYAVSDEQERGVGYKDACVPIVFDLRFLPSI